MIGGDWNGFSKSRLVLHESSERVSVGGHGVKGKREDWDQCLWNKWLSEGQEENLFETFVCRRWTNGDRKKLWGTMDMEKTDRGGIARRGG